MQSKRLKALAAAALTALITTNAYATGLNLTWDWDGEAPFGGPQDGFWFGKREAIASTIILQSRAQSR